MVVRRDAAYVPQCHAIEMVISVGALTFRDAIA
jgi:hypothetical protein